MDKKDINALKKEFKDSDVAKVDLKLLCSYYLRKESEEIFQTRSTYFGALESDEKSLYTHNFKQALGGTLNVKLFELRFKENLPEEELSSRDVFQDMLEATTPEEFLTLSGPIVEKMLNHFSYDKDVVLNFVQGVYETEENMFPFIMGTVNKTEAAKQELTFDYSDREFDVFTNMKLIVKLKTPLDGFMFPIIEDNRANVNKLLNFRSKANEANIPFINEVLTCNPVLTAKAEKTFFNQIVKTLVGASVKNETLYRFYDALNETVGIEERIEDRKIPKQMIQRLLSEFHGRLERNIDEVFEEVMTIQNYEFCFDNVVPNFDSKSVVISNAETEIKVNPSDLKRVEQIVDENGERFLLIRLSDEVFTEGFAIESEREVPISLSE